MALVPVVAGLAVAVLGWTGPAAAALGLLAKGGAAWVAGRAAAGAPRRLPLAT